MKQEPLKSTNGWSSAERIDAFGLTPQPEGPLHPIHPYWGEFAHY